MKKLLAIIVLLLVQFTFAQQRTNENDVPLTYKNPLSKGEVFLSLNPEWFIKDTNDKVIAFTSTDRKVKIMVAASAELSYKKIVENLKKKNDALWEILPAKKILKVKEVQKDKTEQEVIALAYAVPVAPNDDKIVSMMVLLQTNDLPQWERYFDTVAGTLGVIAIKQ
ncbi:hypothetical protein [Flavobacterium sp. AG291]|uniref:hypothetical protein n=1 Tax=Flavobacterium sp. AG291 TaxID=2184000 RepID=UPI000E0C472F|nr:hypothetical protein [Flavobacterium sp. AG291]RDI05656.1 hypothetical protein DEU42_11679 [Flavobacterium sp. AG291]